MIKVLIHVFKLTADGNHCNFAEAFHIQSANCLVSKIHSIYVPKIVIFMHMMVTVADIRYLPSTPPPVYFNRYTNTVNI